MNKYIEHLKVVMKHRWHVFLVCKDLGIPGRGLFHDLSKFSFVEFISSAKHFQKGRSPIGVAKQEYGYSIAWNHHKGKNRHHIEWWLDISHGKLYAIKPEWKDMLEMFADWVGAGIAYNPDSFDQEEPLKYFQSRRDIPYMHPILIVCAVNFLITMADYGYKEAINKIHEIKLVYDTSTSNVVEVTIPNL